MSSAKNSIENKKERRQGGEDSLVVENSLGSPFSSPCPPTPHEKIEKLERKLKWQIQANKALLETNKELLESIEVLKEKYRKRLCR